MNQCENCGKGHGGDAGLCRHCLRELGVSPEGMGEGDSQRDTPRLGHVLSRDRERPREDDVRGAREDAGDPDAGGPASMKAPGSSDRAVGNEKRP